MGGGTEPLIVTVTQREATAEECPTGGSVIEYSHSWQELLDALASSRPCYVKVADENLAVLAPIYMVYTGPDGYLVTNAIQDEPLIFPDADSKIQPRCLTGELPAVEEPAVEAP